MLAVASALSLGELEPLLEKLKHRHRAARQRRRRGGRPSRSRKRRRSEPRPPAAEPAEVRALHAAMRALPPDVVVDHHEFSVAGAGSKNSAPCRDLM